MFEDYIFKYGLHDCKSNNIVIGKDYVKFYFDNGVYRLDDSGKEKCLTKRCLMSIELENLNDNSIDSFIEIREIYKRKIKEINFVKIFSLLKRNEFVITANYYSFFNNTILIRGYIEKKAYEISICNIRKIVFSFNWEIRDTGGAFETCVNETSFTTSSNGSSVELIVGLNKIGITSKQNVDFSKRISAGLYEHMYVRTRSFVSAIALAFLTKWAALPVLMPLR